MTQRHWWLVVPFLGALACGVLAIAIGTAQWTEWFSHPFRDPVPAVTGHGAVLWRIMLVACAAALALIPPVLVRGAPPPTAPAAREPGGFLDRWALGLLMVAALLVRATRLGESLWYDEIAAWFSFGVHGPGPIVGNFFDPANHVAHSLLTWCSVGAFTRPLGFGLALRLPALLLSLGAVPATYGMARCVLATRPALAAAAFMAVMPVAVLEGVEARGYSMMICLAALAHWAFLANAQRERSWLWCAYAGLCAVGVWTQFVTVLVPIGHACWLAWRAAAHGETARALRGGLALLLAAVVAVTLYAPLIPDLLDHWRMYAATRGDEPPVLGPEGFHALLGLGGSWYAWAAWPGLLIAAIGLAAAIRSRPLRAAVAVTLLGLPVLLIAVLASGSWMYARFTLFALPGAALLTAIGLEALWRYRRWAAALAAALLLAALTADLSLRPPKQPLRDAAAFVAGHRAEGESVLVIGLAHQVIDLYLPADLDRQYSLFHGADLAERLRQRSPAWIILYYPNHVSAEAYVLLREHGYVPVARFPGWADWGNGEVRVYTQSLDYDRAGAQTDARHRARSSASPR